MVTLNSPHLSGLEPVVSMHPKTPKTFLRVQRLGLRPLLFCLPPPPRVRGARPSPSVGRPPASWAQFQGLLRARGPRGPLLLSLPALRPFPLPGAGASAAKRPQRRLGLPPPFAGLGLGPRAPPTPWKTPPLRRAFSCGCPQASFLLFDVPPHRPPSRWEPESPRAWPACQGPGHALPTPRDRKSVV